MYDVIIIGGGIVGCSVAYYLGQYDLKAALLEAENDVSVGTTKANSAIVHAGYDPEEGTLMAKHNIKGAELIKELCQKLDVPYKQCGAMVVGFNDEDRQHLEKLYNRGVNNGVEQLRILDQEETLELEPNLSKKVTCSLLVPTSAIVSPWELALAMAETAKLNGVDILLNNRVEAISKDEVFKVKTNQGEYEAKYVINAAGVMADKIHELIGEKEFSIFPAKGEYYLLDKSECQRVSRTIFMCPTKLGKGVLVSPTVHGNLIVGPDAVDTESEDTSTSYEGLAFVRKMATLSVPSVNFRENIRNFAGIRAKNDSGDFIVEESKSVPDFFNIAGIMSPGLSSAPSLALAAVDWLQEKGVELNKKEHIVDERHKVRFKTLPAEEKQKLIKENHAYGRVICRCETITEGEILEAVHGVIPAVSIDGVKRRTNAGMGRCQGGFCSERVADILMREMKVDGTKILQDREGSNILVGHSKGGN